MRFSRNSHQGTTPSAGRSRTLGFEPLECRAMLSLTHLYTFNDGTANDSVGSAHGTLHNGASVIQGGLALYNSGVTSGQSTAVQYAQLPAGILPDGDATIMVWYLAPEASNWSRVFDIGSQSGSNGNNYLFLTPDNGGGSRTTLRVPGVSDRSLSGAATDDGLTHMAAVVVDSSAGMLRLYIDGSAAGATPLSGASTSLIDDSLAYLGRSLYNADPGFTGWIDEVRIYDQAVSAGQIQALAATGAASALPGDYDGNGEVGQSDYLVWRNSYGQSSNLAADGNLDGVVDSADYTIWRDNLGQTFNEPVDLVLDNQSQTYGSLSNTVVELNGESELHITGAFLPIEGSVFHLNSPDAWLFLENIKPSVVASNHLSQVRVSGAPAFLGANVRVVQYELGAVVIPQATGFEPLEVFAGPQFTGDSVKLDQYTYYSNVDHAWFDPLPLGQMNQQISSLKLKRGYMATIATNPDGTGFSKVYVAQDRDLEIPILSSEFDNQVEFVRVLPWRWVAKKGASDRSPDFLNAAWFYNWNNNTTSQLDYEYVPIRQQRWWPGYPHDKPDSTHLLGYNEPNNPVEDAYESLGNGNVDTAIAVWPELMTTGLRLGSPAVTDGGKAWLYEFMDKAIANNLRVDYIAIHNYQANHSATSLYNWLKDVYDRYHLPIWLTEFNNGANWTGSTPSSNSANASVISSFIDMFDNTPWIERYSIYGAVEQVRDVVSYSDGSHTPTGIVYRDNASPIGYVQEVYASGNSQGRSIAQLPLDGDTLDTSGFGSHGAAFGSPSYITGQNGLAIDLDGSNDYVRLATDVASGDAFSFAGWVRWDGGGNWQRIFDFGNNTNQYLFMTPSNGSNMRFVIKNGGGEQIVQTAPLAVGQWTHVAVTLGGGTGRIYLNGTQVASNSMTIRPSDFNPQLNYLGDSQFTNDPFFNGALDDVLITDYVLTPSQIAGLMNGDTAPEFSTNLVELGPVQWGTPFSGSIAGLASDADPFDSVVYGKAHGPAWLQVSPSGVLSGTPALSTKDEFVLTATDSRGKVTSMVLTISYSGGPFIIAADIIAAAYAPAAVAESGSATSSPLSGSTASTSDTSAVELILAGDAALDSENASREEAWAESDFLLQQSDIDDGLLLEDEAADEAFESVFAVL